MADVTGLRAIRYALPEGADASALLCPPYDVIDADDIAALGARSAHNAVHVDVALGGDYAAAGERFRSWLRGGLLVADPRPAVTLVEQRFVGPDGVARLRRGIIAGVKLEPFERAVILPHEHTLKGPKVDRLRLFEALGASASQVFAVYSPDGGDPAASLWRDVDATDGGQLRPLVVAHSDDGVQHRAWRMDDPAGLAELSAGFAGRQLLIADGHHRYETHLAYAESHGPDGAAGRVAMYLCALDDPGTRVYPIHRLVRDVGTWSPSDVVAALVAEPAHFEAEWLPRGGTLASRQEALEKARATFVLAFPDGQAALCRWRGASDGGPLASFPLSVLQDEVFERVFGITKERLAAESNVDFVKVPAEFDARLASGRYTFGVIVPPADLGVVLGAARAGLRMPQKSTYFFPKILTGLVFSPLEEMA